MYFLKEGIDATKFGQESKFSRIRWICCQKKNPSVRIFDLVCHTTYVCVNFFNLWSTPNDRFFWRNFSLFPLIVIAKSQLNGNSRSNTSFVFCFAAWPGPRNLILLQYFGILRILDEKYFRLLRNKNVNITRTWKQFLLKNEISQNNLNHLIYLLSAVLLLIRSNMYCINVVEFRHDLNSLLVSKKFFFGSIFE